VVFQNNILSGVGGQGGAAGYTVDYSCRFDGANKAYLLFTPITSSAAQKTYTLSAWVKRGNLNIRQTVIGASDSGASGFTYALMASNDTGDNIGSYNSGTVYAVQSDDTKLRDPTAWFHTMLTVDTTESVEDNRVIMYYNGERVALTQNIQPTLNGLMRMNDASYGMGVGTLGDYFASEQNFDGYIAQVAQVSELVLAPTDFGEFDANGVWRPIDITELDYSGENSFLLDFADSSDLGNDVSGNDNDFTSSGLAATDQVTDTPTTNYCTLSLVAEIDTSFSDGNLNVVQFGVSAGNDEACAGTMFPTSGKWYWEVEVNGIATSYPKIGIMPDISLWKLSDFASTPGRNILRSIAWSSNGAVEECTALPSTYVSLATYSTYANTDILGIALDLDNGTLFFAKNNTWENSSDPAAGTNPVKTGLLSYGFGAVLGGDPGKGGDTNVDFGQLGFTYTPPTGFNALNTANLATPTILDGTANFQPTLYTGDGSVRSIDQTGNSTFQPDWVWIKSTASAHSHMLIDAPRGVTKQMHSNSTAVETTDTDGLTSFDSDGFGLGTGSGGYNDDTETFVAWQWKAGGGAGSANAVGSITTTTTTVNTTAGISIGTYTGTGVAATIGHGLGVAPQMVIVKERANDVGGWYVYHEGVAVTDPETDYLLLNIAAVLTDDATVWNDTAPTSTVFSIGTNDDVNGSTDTYVYYAFASVEGFSKFGSYTGNGDADGPFIYTGFKPSFVVARGVGARDTFIYDSQRSPYNVVDAGSYINEAAADYTGYKMDFLSNGFKIRTNLTAFNVSGEIIIFWAFAEYPFGGDGVTPATAF